MALLEEMRGGFAEHDVFLHLLLGLLSVSRRLERVLPREPVRGPEEPAPGLTQEEERRVLLLLGLVSVRRTLLGTLEPLRPSGPPGGEACEPRAPLPSPRELLR
jgi:hypothetical protein